MGLSFITAISITGCNSDPRINCSSEEKFKESMEQVTSDMTPEEKMQFGFGILGLIMKETLENPNITNEELRCQLVGGKTKDEILDMIKDSSDED